VAPGERAAPQPTPGLTPLQEAKELVLYWADRLGFGHYDITVRVMTKGEAAVNYGTLSYDHEEEWLVVSLAATDLLDISALEHCVVHELGHALHTYAALGEQQEEAFCNRLAKLLTRKRGARRRAWTPAKGASRSAAKKMAPRLAKLLDLLPPDEREVMELLLWDEASLTEASRVLEMPKYRVQWRRDKALRRLGKVLIEGVKR
jgi:hypothetical protein